MTHEAHLVSRLNIQISFPDLDLAYALRPRVETLGQRLIPRLIERLLDAHAPPGMHLQIDRLDLDLGVLRPDHLEDDALAALKEALSEALGRALHSARSGPHAHARLVSSAANRLAQFETYLTTGASPFTSRSEPFDARRRLKELANDQPGVLVAMLRRRAHGRYVLERLVLQAGEEGLAHLLSVLAPADAAIILGLLADTVLTFRQAPIRALQTITEPALRRMFWMVTLEFLLRDSGSQFNRRSYLAFLLGREAGRLKIALPLLLHLLGLAVQQASARSGLRSSLQGTLAELLRELAPQERPMEVAEGPAAASLVDATNLEDLAGAITPLAFEQLIHAMAPAKAAALLAIVEAKVAAALTRLSESRDAMRLTTAAHAWALEWLSRAAHRAIDEWAFERGLAAAIKQHLAFEGAEASRSHPDDRLARIEHFLRTGHPPDGGAALPKLARRDGLRLAALWRRLVREKPDSVPVLADRLLGWLLPDEVVETLAPDQAELLLRPGQASWRGIISALLRGETPDPPSLQPAHWGRLDQRALIAAWLDTGSAAPQAGELTQALDVLPDFSLAELIVLFLDENEDATAARLWRGLEALKTDRRAVLMAKLAPWATKPSGPLAAALAPLEPARRLEVLSRAAAAALAGGRLDLADLARPLAVEPFPARIEGGRASAARRPTLKQLIAWLEGGAADATEAAILGRHFAALTDAADPALSVYLNANRARPEARARWVKRLPEQAFGRLVHLLAPAGAEALLDSARVISAAWRRVAPFGARRPAPDQLWDLLLEHIATSGRIDLPAVIEAMMRRLTGGAPDLMDRLKSQSVQLAQAGGYSPVVAALRRSPKPSPVAAKPADRKAAPKPSRPPAPQETGESGQTLYVFNAGLVLFHPFLPTFFERLGLLTSDETGIGRIVGVEDASRAAHLLQYLADGRTDRPEPELALNKLLSGQPIAGPVERAITPSRVDLEICDEMIAAVIGHWPIMKNSTADALRETFLQREGRLQRGDGKWTLHVQRRTLDVLTDQVPWGFSLVYQPWMADPIHVTW